MKLTPYFKEMLDKRWSEFVQIENDEQYSSQQAVIFSLIRACARGKLPAIKEALNRIDGKMQEKIEVEYPKFYMLFPYATSVAELPAGKIRTDMSSSSVPEPIEAPEVDEIPTGSLRATLDKMSEQPRALVSMILAAAKEIEEVAAYKGDAPENDPLVKSVIVAGLLKMAHSGNLGAIFEVLDQIDGKVADKIKVMGDDVYMSRYDEIAPYGAEKNADGIYQISADNTQSAWAVSLERQRKVSR